MKLTKITPSGADYRSGLRLLRTEDLNGGWESIGTNFGLKIAREGWTVHIWGGVRKTVEMPEERTVVTLPLGLRPVGGVSLPIQFYRRSYPIALGNLYTTSGDVRLLTVVDPGEIYIPMQSFITSDSSPVVPPFLPV